MMSVGEALPAQQARCRNILEAAISIGAPGNFLAAMLRIDLRKAEEAVMSGDVVRMIEAHQALSTYRE